MAVPGVGAKEMEDTPVQTKVVSVEQFIQSSTEGEDPLEAEKIEEALVAQGYFRNDVPLTYDEQDFLHTACQESGVPYALALAVIEKETGFRNVIGDDGASCGFMQVQERWHWDRMERLGVTDLSDPFWNFRVGCDFLAELLDKYPVEEALTAYNSRAPLGPAVTASRSWRSTRSGRSWSAMKSAALRAESRLGIEVPEDLLEKARRLTDQKMKVKGLPEDYREPLLEDVIVETVFMAAINGRCSECVQSA